jgi:NTP pyrophosphatase (non-canonical NTP hydrolase)
MDVKALQARLDAFARERGWDVLQNPRNLAIALAGEAGMLLDLFRWLTDAQSHRIESEYKREAAEEAIADLLLHTLRLADKLDIDVERAVAKKLAENEANYPPPALEAPVAPVRTETPKPAAAKPVVEPAPVAKETAPKPAAALVKPAPPAEEKAPAEKLPTWLDGIMPARSGGGRRKQPAAAKAQPSPPAPPPAAAKAREVPSPSPAPERIEPAVERIEAAPPPPDEPAAVPAPGPVSEPLRERYPHLDTDAAKTLAKSLAKRVDTARSDDPLLRELHDEVETLRRTLYSPTPKRSWIGDSLKTIHALLEEAETHEVGQAIRAQDYAAQIERILKP